MIATQLAKFRLGVFPAAFPRSLAAAAAATDSSNFFRQIKTKNAAIEHTKLNKHSRFIWWGKLQQQPRGWGQRSAVWRKITRKSCNSCLLKKAWKAEMLPWQQLWQAAAAAAAAGVSSGFSSISRAEDFPTNLNVTCEQISTRSSIHSAPTHTHRHCHIVWQHDATSCACNSLPSGVARLFTFSANWPQTSKQSTVNGQRATCNMQQAGSEHSMPTVEHQSLVI